MASCDECDEPARAKGKCKRHYQAMMRATRPDVVDAIARRSAEKKRMLEIVAWYDAELAKADAGDIKRAVGEVLIDQWQIQGALALLTKLHSRRPETMLYDPDYEFTGGLLRCLEAGRDALGLTRRVA